VLQSEHGQLVFFQTFEDLEINERHVPTRCRLQL